jgi:hypothetical protein
MANPHELGNADLMPDITQRLWTSDVRLGGGPELCSIINDALRSDMLRLVEPVATLARAMNKLCVTARGTPQHVRNAQPPDNLCYRGGGFRDEHRDFFVAGRQFRQPAFLATSFDRAVTDNFIQRAIDNQRVLWVIHINEQRGCMHVNLVTKIAANIPDEQEYLFVPYSAFRVISAQWKTGDRHDPHEIHLEAAVDNDDAAESPLNLPLAPWS